MDLQKVAMTDFVLLMADWPAVQGRALIRVLQPPYIIVQRREAGGEEYFYLLPTTEALGRMQNVPNDMSIRQALDLHETGASPALEGTANADDAPDRVVILTEGQVSGYFDADALPPSTTRSTRTIPTDTFEEPVERLLQADFPDTVSLNESVSLLVYLSSDIATGGGVPVTQPMGTVIDIVVQARRGFILEGSSESSLTLSEELETLPLQFKLRAAELGLGEIRVLAFQKGIALGALVLRPTVREAPADASTTQPFTHSEPLTPVMVRLPDLSLLIEETKVNGDRAFLMRISALDPTHELNLARFGPISFDRDPGRYFEQFYEDIDGFPLTSATDRAIATVQLATKGADLYEKLVPAEARRTLWSLKDQIKTVLIQSEEPWIPWELCKLVHEEAGQVEEGPFFCEIFAVSRWIPGSYSPWPSLKLGNIAVVVPADSGLAFAFDERDYLRSLAGANRRVTEVPARFIELYQSLASGKYDVWHFSGHGLSRDPDPNRLEMHLENNQVFIPGNLSGTARGLGKTRPIIFLNACQIGRGGKTLTGVGGWAQQFLRARAGAFIGAYWSVYDQPAYQFAKEFYSRLLAGTPIAKACQEARLAIRSDGDPSWLAYTLFAHPLATVQD